MVNNNLDRKKPHEDFAVTCPLVPDAPHLISGFCSSPRRFGLGDPATRRARGVQAGKSIARANPAFTLQTPRRDDALALLLAFGYAKT